MTSILNSFILPIIVPVITGVAVNFLTHAIQSQYEQRKSKGSRPIQRKSFLSRRGSKKQTTKAFYASLASALTLVCFAYLLKSNIIPANVFGDINECMIFGSLCFSGMFLSNMCVAFHQSLSHFDDIAPEKVTDLETNQRT